MKFDGMTEHELDAYWRSKEEKMGTPVFDKALSEWQEAIASAEARATKELKLRVLSVLGEVKRPTAAMKKLMEECK